MNDVTRTAHLAPHAVTFFPVNTITAHYRGQNLDIVLESGNKTIHIPPHPFYSKLGCFTVGCLLFSTGSLNSGTTLDGGVGE